MTQHFSGSEFWDERFQDGEYMYGTQVNDFLQEEACLIPKNARVLMLAEGEGRNAVYLAEQGCHVRGVDFSAKGREKALKLANERNVEIEYELADLTCYPMGNSEWDAIVSIFCHLHETDRPKLYQSVKEALKPGGLFIQEVYNQEQLEYRTGGPSEVSYLGSLTELANVFEDLEIVFARDTVREIHEGNFHVGSSSVTQFIARKPS